MWNVSNLLSGSYLRISLSAIQYLGLDLFVYNVTFTVETELYMAVSRLTWLVKCGDSPTTYCAGTSFINLANVKWLR